MNEVIQALFHHVSMVIITILYGFLSLADFGAYFRRQDPRNVSPVPLYSTACYVKQPSRSCSKAMTFLRRTQKGEEVEYVYKPTALILQ